MQKKQILITLFLTAIFLVSSTVVSARLLPRFRGRAVGVSGVSVGVRLRADHQALEVSFNNLGKAKSVTYTLMYQTNGVDQGVSGSLDLSVGNSASRELLFGTCSNGVCRYHTNITNAKFEVRSELVSGKTTIRRFRIRV